MHGPMNVKLINGLFDYSKFLFFFYRKEDFVEECLWLF